MGKFDDDKREDLQNAFAYLEVPDEDDFAAFIQAIADGIEGHEHVPCEAREAAQGTQPC